MRTCIYCNKPMVEATRGRDFVTYRCPKGDPYYLSEETSTHRSIPVPPVDKSSLYREVVPCK
jgi:hypothetical protein